MRMRDILALAACAAIGLSGCDRIRSAFTTRGDAADPAAAREGGSTARAASFDADDQAGDTSDDPTPTRGEREVEFPVTAEQAGDSARAAGLDAARFADATVPVLAPAGMSRGQAVQFTESFRATPDGYFARMSLEEFDVVVNGTRIYARAPEAAGAPPARDTSQYQYSESETGMSVTFSRFGADYSVDFVCRGAGDEGGSECVSEAEAAELVGRLVPVGGGGR